MTETGALSRYSNMFVNMFEYRLLHTNLFSNVFSTMLEYLLFPTCTLHSKNKTEENKTAKYKAGEK